MTTLPAPCPSLTIRSQWAVILACVSVIAGTATADPGAASTAADTTIELDTLLPTHNHDFNAALVAAVERLKRSGGVIRLRSSGEYHARSRTPISRSQGDAEIRITTQSGESTETEERAIVRGAISLRDAQNLRIENVRVLGDRGSRRDGISIGQCRGIMLRHVECRDAGSVGIRISGTDDIQLTQSTVLNSRAHGVRVANCSEVTLDGVSIIEAGGYGIGVQDGTQFTRGLKILNSRIIRSRGDGIDIKGQREDGPPLVVIDGLDVLNSGGRKSAALDLRGHVSVSDVTIRLNPGSTGLRFRLGDAIGTQEESNGWAGYGIAERVTIESDTTDGIGIVVQSGGVALNECAVNGPVEKRVEIYEWANNERPVVVDALSINGERIADREQFLALGGAISKQPTVVFE